jgi:hypothetical protein
MLVARSVFCVRHFLVTSLKILGALQPCHRNCTARSAASDALNEGQCQELSQRKYMYAVTKFSAFILRLNLDDCGKVQENNKPVEVDGYIRCTLMTAMLICLEF